MPYILEVLHVFIPSLIFHHKVSDKKHELQEYFLLSVSP